MTIVREFSLALKISNSIFCEALFMSKKNVSKQIRVIRSVKLNTDKNPTFVKLLITFYVKFVQSLLS